MFVDGGSGRRVEVMWTHYATQQFPRHTHDLFTVGVGLRGIGMLWYHGTNYIRHHDDVVVIPPGEVHTGGVGPRATVLSYLAVYVPPEILAESAEAEGIGGGRLPEFRAPVFEDAPVAAALRRLGDLLHPRASSPLAVRAGADQTNAFAAEEALSVAMATLVRRQGRTRTWPPASELPVEPHVVRTVREILHDCYDEPARTRLSALAAEARVSPCYVVRAFTRATGVSPHEYLLQIRVRRARELLAVRTPPSLVAAMTGFADQSHLTTQFRRYTGITPARYQRCLVGAECRAKLATASQVVWRRSRDQNPAGADR